MKHIFNFRDPPNCPIYNFIKNGTKIVECRKNSSTYQKIKTGDIILLNDRKGILYCKVTFVHKYENIAEYLKKETIQKA